MNWNSASEFFAMGGYGLYVWGSYAVVALWMLCEPLAAHRRHQAALQQIDYELSRKDAL
jgi:heme exporter protein D